ncbi:MAG: hypothetical protein RBS24_00030 [Bacilli bacterium]|nr:hypothetical protein [Bacilli bacterium]
MNNKHNTRAEELYKMLLNNAGKWVSQEDICNKLPELFPTQKSKNGTTLNRHIWDAVQQINDSLDEYTLIVITHKRKYKIPTHEEAVEYLKNEFTKHNKKTKRLNHLKNKLKLDGLGNLLEDGDELKFIQTTAKGDLNDK